MMTRVNVRCPACGWYTSRAPKADGDYGQCYWCRAAVAPVKRREFFKAPAPAATATPTRTRYHKQYATWPELVAAEMERLEQSR